MADTRALTVSELAKHPFVIAELESAWQDSLPDQPEYRHEEGGWVYQNPDDGSIQIRRAVPGESFSIDLGSPPILDGWCVIATFHTHPHPSAEGWYTGPSRSDTLSAHRFGVPCVIRADDGIHTTGPESRRGGLTGMPGFPKKPAAGSVMSTSTTTKDIITPDEALSAAHVDAVAAYRNLSLYRIEIVLEQDGWHIDYELRDPNMKGGGPHYLIDAETGEIVSKRYEQ